MKLKRGRATGKATLDDVARVAGVSAITASRALRQVSTVDATLARKVLDAARQLQYFPNPAARALASSRSASVVVLVPSFTNAVFGALLESLNASLRACEYHLLVGDTHYSHDEEELLLRSFLMHNPSGLIVTGFDRNEITRELIQASGVPCVHIMEVSPTPGVYSVGFSQVDSGYAMTRHLLDSGARRIVYAAGQLDVRAMQRAQGYRKAMQEAQCYSPEFEILSPSPSSVSLGANMFRQIRGQLPTAQAIFYCNDNMAHGGLLEAARMGITVPSQIKIAGFNDVEESSYTFPRLTTIATPRAEIGLRAADMLVQLMRGEPVAQSCLDLGFKLVVRESA
jgi:LacI family transcriptional regulator, gluconate utilization system Gnt-I transcriptional repressor